MRVVYSGRAGAGSRCPLAQWRTSPGAVHGPYLCKRLLRQLAQAVQKLGVRLQPQLSALGGEGLGGGAQGRRRAGLLSRALLLLLTGRRALHGCGQSLQLLMPLTVAHTLF